MFLLQQIAPAAIVGILLTVACGVVARRILQPILRGIILALAPGASYAVAHAMIAGAPGFPPADVIHWIFYFALAAVPFGISDSLGVKGRGVLVLFAMFCIGALSLLLQPKFKYGWKPMEGVAWLIGLTMVMTLSFQGLRVLVSRMSGGTTLIVMAVAAGGAAAALSLSGSLLLAQLALALACAVVGLLAFGMSRTEAAAACVPCSAAVYVSLLISGYFYAELPGGSALILACAPFASMVKPLPRDRAPDAFGVLRILPTFILAALAVLIAYRLSPPLESVL